MLTSLSKNQRSAMAPLTERRTRPSSRTSRKSRSPEASVPEWTVKLWRLTWVEG